MGRWSGSDVYRVCGAAQLWPRVQACAEQVAREQLQPLLDASKPLWINDIRIKQYVPSHAPAQSSFFDSSVYCSVLGPEGLGTSTPL